MCIYLFFHRFNGEKGVLKVEKIHRKTQGQNHFFNKFAGSTDVFTYHLNLRIFEHTS